MKKLITLCVMLVACVATSFADNTATIYVKADVAPYLHAWAYGADDAAITTVNWPKSWPGYYFTAGDIVSIKGVDFYKKEITYTGKLGIIFNNNAGGQTGDISDVSGTVYYTYNGTNSAQLLSQAEPTLYNLLTNDFTVVGNAALLGSEFDPSDTDNDMVTYDNGALKLTKTGVALKKQSYYYKIVKNHAWGSGSEWPASGSDPANYDYYFGEAGIYDVTFSFNGSAGSITSVTKTGAYPITSYGLVGTFPGMDWDTDDWVMTQSTENENVYVYQTVKDLTAMEYEYRLRANGEWNIYELPAAGNNSYTFNEAGKYRLTFTADVANHTLTLSAEKVIKLTNAKETFSSKHSLDFSNTGLSVYAVTELTATSAKLTSVTGVPNYNGVLLMGTPNVDYYVPFASPENLGLPDGVTNKLQAAAEACEVKDDWKCYILWTDGCFHPANNGWIPAGRAYLKASDVEGAGFDPDAQGARLALVFDNESTGIESMKAANVQNNVVYNLAGQRIAQPAKGLYIVNGKKVVLK